MSRRKESYYIGVFPDERGHPKPRAFVHDPHLAGRFVCTDLCVLFTACQQCGAELYVPCISSKEKAVFVFVRGTGWRERIIRQHLAIPCLSRRASWREMKKRDSQILAKHGRNVEIGRWLAKWPDQ